MKVFSPRNIFVVLALVCGSNSAFAQDVMCSGIGDDGRWIGENEAGSDIVSADAALQQFAVIPRNSTHVSLFSLSEAAQVRLEVVGSDGDDTMLELYDVNGMLIAEVDDSGGDSSARVETILEAGTYCLSALGFDGEGMMANISIGLAEHAALTDGSGTPFCGPATTATDLASMAIDDMLSEGIRASNSVSSVPYYRFTLNAPAPLSLTAENSDADPILYLFDNNGELLAENDDFDGLNSRIDMASPLPAGKYCIGVDALSDSSSNIRLTVEAYDSEAMLMSLYNSAEASPPLDGSYPVTDLGLLGNRLRLDGRSENGVVWYSFEIEEAGIVLIESIAVGSSDPVLSIFDDIGRKLQYNDDAGEGLDAMVTVRVNPGTYIFAVTQSDDSADSAIVRVLLERFVVAK